jgi:hypothetical protein
VRLRASGDRTRVGPCEVMACIPGSSVTLRTAPGRGAITAEAGGRRAERTATVAKTTTPLQQLEELLPAVTNEDLLELITRAFEEGAARVDNYAALLDDPPSRRQTCSTRDSSSRCVWTITCRG